MELAKADNIRRFGNIPALKPKPCGVTCITASGLFWRVVPGWGQPKPDSNLDSLRDIGNKRRLTPLKPSRALQG